MEKVVPALISLFFLAVTGIVLFSLFSTPFSFEKIVYIPFVLLQLAFAVGILSLWKES